jgi:dTDP-4-amino-4,6-dideoxygalactose transaminase
LISHLCALGITSPFHYLPLHLSDKGKEFGGKAGDCPVTEDVSNRLLRLPFYNDLTDADLDRVVAGVLSFRIK